MEQARQINEHQHSLSYGWPSSVLILNYGIWKSRNSRQLREVWQHLNPWVTSSRRKQNVVKPTSYHILTLHLVIINTSPYWSSWSRTVRTWQIPIENSIQISIISGRKRTTHFSLFGDCNFLLNWGRFELTTKYQLDWTLLHIDSICQGTITNFCYA